MFEKDASGKANITTPFPPAPEVPSDLEAPPPLPVLAVPDVAVPPGLDCVLAAPPPPEPTAPPGEVG